MPSLFSGPPKIPAMPAPAPVPAPVAMPVPTSPNNNTATAQQAQTIAGAQASSGRDSTNLVKEEGTSATLGGN